MLTDTDRIRNLLGRYTELIDAGDFDGVGRLFTHGTVATADGTPIARGAEAVAALYRATTRRHGDTPRTKHLVLDTIFDEPGPDGLVSVRSSYVVLQAVDGLPLQPIIAGRYHDRFERDPVEPGRWRFVERRMHVDLVGDLSSHLLIDPPPPDPTLAPAD